MSLRCAAHVFPRRLCRVWVGWLVVASSVCRSTVTPLPLIALLVALSSVSQLFPRSSERPCISRCLFLLLFFQLFLFPFRDCVSVKWDDLSCLLGGPYPTVSRKRKGSKGAGVSLCSLPISLAPVYRLCNAVSSYASSGGKESKLSGGNEEICCALIGWPPSGNFVEASYAPEVSPSCSELKGVRVSRGDMDTFFVGNG